MGMPEQRDQGFRSNVTADSGIVTSHSGHRDRHDALQHRHRVAHVFHISACTYTAMMKSWCWQLHQTAGSQATGFLEGSSDNMLLVMDTHTVSGARSKDSGRRPAQVQKV